MLEILFYSDSKNLTKLNQNKLKMIITHLSTFCIFSGNTNFMTINLRKNSEQENSPEREIYILHFLLQFFLSSCHRYLSTVLLSGVKALVCNLTHPHYSEITELLS